MIKILYIRMRMSIYYSVLSFYNLIHHGIILQIKEQFDGI
jgi:hypothetical protein